jgi:hypothetical protein
MKNVTHSFVFLAHWPSAGSFGLNTNILAGLEPALVLTISGGYRSPDVRNAGASAMRHRRHGLSDRQAAQSEG